MKIFNFCIISGLFLLISCGETEKNLNQETVNGGSATILCDEMIMPLVKAAKPYYDSAFPDAKITLQQENAREAMVRLLGGKTRAIIIARDYLKDEDSAMQLHSIIKHQRFLFAIDGVVLFANKHFSADTISKEQIIAAMGSRLPTLSQSLKSLTVEPLFVSTNSTSSLYGNIMNQFSGGSAPVRPMKYFSTQDSVAEFVKNHDNAIGFGYMSKFGRDTSVKLLRIGFSDSAGKRIYPQTVHPGNIVQGKYPFPVYYYGYLLEERMNLPWGFFTFMRTDKRAQQFFLDSGIVPAFAKLELIEQ